MPNEKDNDPKIAVTDMFTTMVRHDQEMDRQERASVREKLKAPPAVASPKHSAKHKTQER